jgi:hypothetical protein
MPELQADESCPESVSTKTVRAALVRTGPKQFSEPIVLRWRESRMTTMEDRIHDFKASPQEVNYLKLLASHHASLRGLLRIQSGEEGRKSTIYLSRAEAEQLRGYLTDRLPVVGLDRDFSLTEEVQILEELIDRFFLR